MAPRVVLITGANRGIGFSIVQALASRSPLDQYLLATRSPEKAIAAIDSLRSIGIKADLDTVLLDVASDASILEAERIIREKYGKLDVLINNAGAASIPKQDLSDFRASYNSTLDTNVTAVALMMTVFLPLLKESSLDPRIINVSSARGSMSLSTSGKLPPTAAIAYSVSKTALNALTVEYAKAHDNKGVIFQCVSPGHCKTAFNGYRGTKDPLDGAKVVVELVICEKEKFLNGFWQLEGDDVEPTKVPW